MLHQELCRLENSLPFFRGHVQQSGAAGADPVFEWLKLSHALDAVRSPCAAQKFQYDRTTRPLLGKREGAIAIGSRQHEIGRRVANGESFRPVLHLSRTLDQRLAGEQ